MEDKTWLSSATPFPLAPADMALVKMGQLALGMGHPAPDQFTNRLVGMICAKATGTSETNRIRPSTVARGNPARWQHLERNLIARGRTFISVLQNNIIQGLRRVHCFVQQGSCQVIIALFSLRKSILGGVGLQPLGAQHLPYIQDRRESSFERKERKNAHIQRQEHATL